jgi:alpha-ribazole phosphatase
VTLRFDVLRHGATAVAGYCGSTDVALTEAGTGQMWNAVHDRRWHRILTSPLQRCAGFAEALAARLDIPFSSEPRLREMHFGRWENRTAEQLMRGEAEALRRFWSDPFGHPPPDAEPLGEVCRRVLDLVRELAVIAAAEHLLLVTHGGPIRILLAAATTRPRSELLQIEVPHAALFQLRARVGQGGDLLLQPADG